MTPAARLAAVIEILATSGAQPLDRFLKNWFRARRFAGSGDRRAITERVFQIARRQAHFQHRMASDTPRALAIASVLAQDEDPEGFFIGGYGPAPLDAAERAAIAASPPPPPLWVQGEFPPFLETELVRAFGDGLLDEMAAFQQRAPVDLRVNCLKAEHDTVLAALTAEGVACAAMAYARDGIRAAPGTFNLDRHPLFAAGAFEVQDEAAQIAVLLCQARPGMRVADLAAGAGGKSLALAAAMQNRGAIVAADIRGAALFELERRAARAGATIIRTHILGDPPGGPFELVLVDAPCSGSGTWRRQPENKWRLTPERLAGLMATQDGLLDQAAALLPPGGRLVYATCSILGCENQDRVAAFLERTPSFILLDAGADWRGVRPPGLGRDFRATPAQTGTDGFFCAVLGRI